MVHLRLFGTADVHIEDGPELRPVVLQPKRLALLAYLAASPRGVHRRDTLLGLFWPELDGARARGALSKALHYLRRSLGEETLVTQGDEELRVDPAHLWCDVAAFQRAIDQGRCAEALDLYRGDLLQGFFLTDAPEFERWLDQEREWLRRRAAAACWRLAESAEADGSLLGAIDWARRGLVVGSEDEAGLRRLIVLLERAGDRAGAVAVYQEFSRRLAQEYEVEPSAETQALIARVREARFTSETDSAARAVASSGGDAATAGVIVVRQPHRSVAPSVPPAETAELAPAAASEAAASPRSGYTSRLAAVGAVAALAVVSLSYLLPRDATPALHPQRVVVAPFENRTGQPALAPVGSMATDWIIQGLAHTGLVEVVPFTATLSSARVVTAEATGTVEGIRALAHETGAGIVVSGSYYLQGDSLYLQARITDALAGNVLLAFEPVSAAASLPLAAVEALRQRVMAGLAPHVNPRLADYARIASRTPSYPAYHAYAEGMERFVATDWRGAIERFDRAAEQDTSYTLPLVLSAIAYANLGDYAAVDALASRLAPHHDRLAEYDRLAVTAASAWARGDYATSYRAAVRVAELAPNTIAHGQIARELLMLNRPREALGVLARLDPQRGELRGWPVYWENLAAAHHLLGEHRKERQAARRARALHPEDPSMLRLELRALAARGRVAEVLRAVDEHLASPAGGHPRTGVLLRQTALELHAHGHADAARQLLLRSLEWYLARPAEVQATPGFRRTLGEAYYLAGRREYAQQVLAALAAERPDDLALQGRLGTLAARRGDRAEAEQIAAWLAALERPYLLGEHTYWRARIAALLGEDEEAIALLRDAYAQGRYEWIDLHTEPDLDPIRGHPAFRERVRPQG